MDEIDKLAAMAELKNEQCALNHGGYECDNKAVDYLTVPFGYKTDEIEYTQTEELLIPICKSCAETLYNKDNTWILYYCIGCSSSQWIIRELMGISKQRDMVQWLDECPHCKNK